MIKKMICIAVCAWMCASCEKSEGGVFEPVEPPIEKPEEPTTPPSTEDLRTIKNRRKHYGSSWYESLVRNRIR